MSANSFCSKHFLCPVRLCAYVEDCKSYKYYSTKNLNFTSQETHRVSITNTNHLMIINARIGICCDNHMKCIRTPCEKNSELLSVNIGRTCSNECAMTGYNR